MDWEEGEGRQLNEELEVKMKQIREELRRGERESGGIRRGGWWDGECEEKRKKVRKTLRGWRRGEGNGELYRKGRAEYKLLCRRKKNEENERMLKEAKEARTEGEIWKIVNRERRWNGARKRIPKEEWKEYFMKLLGGVDYKVVKRGKGRRGEDEERELGWDEIKRIIEKQRKGKAAGGDGIPGEVWKYGGEGMEKWVWKLCNRVWRGEGWPEIWKEGIIIPIRKKGKGERVEEYRGVTLLSTLYKIYTGLLTEKLETEIEEKNIIPQNQTGFRKGMGVRDNIYVLNYIVNRQLVKKGGMVVAAFIDLKAAFDSVD